MLIELIPLIGNAIILGVGIDNSLSVVFFNNQNKQIVQLFSLRGPVWLAILQTCLFLRWVTYCFRSDITSIYDRTRSYVNVFVLPLTYVIMYVDVGVVDLNILVFAALLGGLIAVIILQFETYHDQHIRGMEMRSCTEVLKGLRGEIISFRASWDGVSKVSTADLRAVTAPPPPLPPPAPATRDREAPLSSVELTASEQEHKEEPPLRKRSSSTLSGLDVHEDISPESSLPQRMKENGLAERPLMEGSSKPSFDVGRIYAALGVAVCLLCVLVLIMFSMIPRNGEGIIIGAGVIIANLSVMVELWALQAVRYETEGRSEKLFKIRILCEFARICAFTVSLPFSSSVWPL